MLTAAIPVLGYVFAVAVAVGEPATWLKTVGGTFAVAGVLLAARAAVRRNVASDPAGAAPPLSR